jgi:transcriptional regulator with XRE-family HTH domain
MTEQFSLGTRLRDLRKERILTQKELASKAGISVNAVSLIERNEISPSVATLQTLAEALNVEMSYFFDEPVQANIVHLKQKQRPFLTGDGVTIQSVGQRLPAQQIEPFLLILEPWAKSGKDNVIHSGHEFLYCLEGTVEYEVNNQIYLLEKGDILLFEASQPHRWRNPTDQEVELLLILETTDEETEPVRGHFPGHPSLVHLG